MRNKSMVIMLTAAALCGFGCGGDSASVMTGGSINTGAGGTASLTGGASGGGGTSLSGGSIAPGGGGTTGSGGGTGTGGMVNATGAVTTSGGSTSGGDMGGTGGTAGMCETPTGTCADAADGIYAMMTELDLYWLQKEDASGNPDAVSNPGRGKMRAFMLGELSDSCMNADGSGTGMGKIKACGSALPPMSSNLLCGVFEIAIPDSAWDSPNMPTFNTTGMVTSFEPGGLLTIDTVTSMIGIALDDPNGSWPAPESTASVNTSNFTCPAGSGVQCFPDDDGDGNPGITATIRHDGVALSPQPGPSGSCAQDYAYLGAPLDQDIDQLTGSPDRAGKAYLGFRLVMGGGGAINDTCDGGSGEAVATMLNTRIYGCQLVDGSTECTATQAEFLDTHTPQYIILQKGETPQWNATAGIQAPAWSMSDSSASPGPRGAMIRVGSVGDTVTCQQVRDAFNGYTF